MLAVLFGAALSLCGERAQPVTHLIELATEVLFKIIGFIVRLAPLGVFGAIAYTVGAYGVSSLQQLGMLVVLYYLTVIFFVVVILGGILRLAGFSIFKFLRYLREELMIVLGTASSDAVLPQVMRKLEHMGIKDSTVGLVIPTGYSFNLDAFSIYLTLATVFIAQATNTPLAFMDLVLILAVALLTSKGAHGIPGSAIVVLAATLSAVPVIPAIGLVLVLSVDWFMGMARALGNMTGNCVATVVIAAWEGDIDRERAHRVLNGEGEDPSEARSSTPSPRRTTHDADLPVIPKRRAALPPGSAAHRYCTAKERSDALLDPALERGLRRRPGPVRDHLAALEHEQRRNAAHPVLGGQVRVLVHVDLRHDQLAVVLLGQLLERGSDHLARPAPLRPEVHQDRDGGVEHLALESLVRHLDRRHPARLHVIRSWKLN